MAIRQDNKKVVYLVVFAIIVIVDILFILGWQWRTLLKSYKNAREKKQAIVAFKRDSANLEANKKEIADLDKKIKEAELLIIDEANFSSLLESVSNLANSSGVKITQIKPIVAEANQKFIQTQDAKFGERKIQIIANSDFHQLGNFISKIESSKSFLKIFSLDIVPDNKNYFIQNIALSMKAFVKVKK